MRKRMITLLAVLTATLALATTPAYALRSFDIRPGGAVSASGSIMFTEEGLNEANGITCNVTLLKTLSTRIPKINGTLMGRVTGVAIDLGRLGTGEHCRAGANLRNVLDIIALRESTGALNTRFSCRLDERTGIKLCDVTGGEARLWKIIYEKFDGTLPSISDIRIRIERVQFKIDFNTRVPAELNLRCLYQGTIGATIVIAAETSTATRLRLNGDAAGLFSELTFFCPARGVLRGTYNFSTTQTIRLV